MLLQTSSTDPAQAFLDFFLGTPLGLAILGIAATAIIGIPVYFIHERRKKLTKQLISSTSFNTADWNTEDEITNSIQILVDGEIVRNVHLVVFEIRNAGDIGKPKRDYEQPVSLDFGEAQLHKVIVTGRKPNNLEVAIDKGISTVAIQPGLMNTDDWFRITALVSRDIKTISSNDIALSFRITDVRDIPDAKEAEENRFWKALLLLFSYFLGGCLVIGSFFQGSQYGTIIAVIFTLGLVLLQLLVAWWLGRR